MSQRDQKQNGIPGMCQQGNECVRDLRDQGKSQQEAIDECCRRGGHQPGDGHSPDRRRRRGGR